MNKLYYLLLAMMLLLSACTKKKTVPDTTNPIDYADMTYWYAFG